MPVAPPPGATAPGFCAWPKRYSERSFIARHTTTVVARPAAIAPAAWTSEPPDPPPPCGMRDE